MRRFLEYNSKLKERTRELRKNMTILERKIWYRFLRTLKIDFSPSTPLIKRELKGDLSSRELYLRESKEDFCFEKIRVYNQRMIKSFIVDFYIPSYKLVIEIDWESHFTENWIEYDKERTNILEWMWLEIIRFTNNQVLYEFEWVCEKIIKKIKNKDKTN